MSKPLFCLLVLMLTLCACKAAPEQKENPAEAAPACDLEKLEESLASSLTSELPDRIVAKGVEEACGGALPPELLGLVKCKGKMLCSTPVAEEDKDAYQERLSALCPDYLRSDALLTIPPGQRNLCFASVYQSCTEHARTFVSLEEWVSTGSGSAFWALLLFDWMTQNNIPIDTAREVAKGFSCMHLDERCDRSTLSIPELPKDASPERYAQALPFARSADYQWEMVTLRVTKEDLFLNETRISDSLESYSTTLKRDPLFDKLEAEVKKEINYLRQTDEDRPPRAALMPSPDLPYEALWGGLSTLREVGARSLFLVAFEARFFGETAPLSHTPKLMHVPISLAKIDRECDLYRTANPSQPLRVRVTQAPESLKAIGNSPHPVDLQEWLAQTESPCTPLPSLEALNERDTLLPQDQNSFCWVLGSKTLDLVVTAEELWLFEEGTKVDVEEGCEASLCVKEKEGALKERYDWIALNQALVTLKAKPELNGSQTIVVSATPEIATDLLMLALDAVRHQLPLPGEVAPARAPLLFPITVLGEPITGEPSEAIKAHFPAP